MQFLSKCRSGCRCCCSSTEVPRCQAVPLQGALAPVWGALIAVYERVGPVIKRDFFAGFAKDVCSRATASSQSCTRKQFQMKQLPKKIYREIQYYTKIYISRLYTTHFQEIDHRRLAIIISSAKGFIIFFLQKNGYSKKTVARFDIQKMEMYKINQHSLLLFLVQFSVAWHC